MKSWVESFLIALSMYSTLPVKCLNWTEENLRHALVFFPLVGLLCGGGLWLVWTGCGLLHVGSVLFAVLAVLSVVVITGGIHLDGFCDTTDALYSRRSQEEKLRILKDPHCGPFAVFSVFLVLLISFGAYTELYRTQNVQILGLLTGGFVMTRCLSGISLTRFPCAPTSSLAKTFGEHAGKHVGIVLLIECMITGFFMVLWYHWLAVILIELSVVIFLCYYHMQKKQFGGLTGDLAGFFLVLNETAWVLGTALLGGVLK
ncbi:MAG: adenosylcobinamide-GDP ribazoletransferase [Ruminococcus sp.]